MKTMYPIRGQTLVARFDPQISREIMLWHAKDTASYVVPRPGPDTLILGGTKDGHNSDPVPTPDVSEKILDRCKQLLLDLGQGGSAVSGSKLKKSIWAKGSD